jgi:hypothetical protein
MAGLFELLGLFLIGKKIWYGFISNIAGCILWIAVATNSKNEIQGLLLVVIPAIILNIMNIKKWKNNETAKDN